jgi:hypothetical protein
MFQPLLTYFTQNTLLVRKGIDVNERLSNVKIIDNKT